MLCWLGCFPMSHGQGLSEGLRSLEDPQHLLLCPTDIAGAVWNIGQARQVMSMHLHTCNVNIIL